MRGKTLTNHELFQFPNITPLQECNDEYTEIVQKSPNRGTIKRKLLALLDLLNSTKSISDLCKTSSFEKLTGVSESLYALKIKTGCNIRIIFSYERDGSILLLMFEEKEGKRKTDYSEVIPIAIKRLKAAKGGKQW